MTSYKNYINCEGRYVEITAWIKIIKIRSVFGRVQISSFQVPGGVTKRTKTASNQKKQRPQQLHRVALQGVMVRASSQVMIYQVPTINNKDLWRKLPAVVAYIWELSRQTGGWPWKRMTTVVFPTARSKTDEVDNR
ncbi:hypothetical protein RUM43_007018 [Polyplax serrata]|uniref:Uncharacterized protein n=1 Tax=Polyplax serrata TaxID=468196 RepID=A0AAN8P818_POLSC